MRRLIINADDFGLTPGVNRAILEAHRRGIVTSATIMANGAAAEEAIRKSGSVPSLSLGCHVQLVDGAPVSDCRRIPTLVGRFGQFRPSFAQFASAVLRKQVDEGEVELEAAAQMKSLSAAGVAVTHFDTHKHVHVFTTVLRPLVRAARACGIRALRNPFAPLKPLARAHLLRRPKLWKRYSEVRILRLLSAKFRRIVADEGLVTTDGTFGVVVTGALDERLFAAIAGSIPPGTWEFVCHPGYNDLDLGRVRTRLRQSREKELQVLTSSLARDVLDRNGIELISYRDLTG